MNDPAPDGPPVTGQPAVDAALAGLDLNVPVGEHAEAIGRVHQMLYDVLNPGSPPHPPR